MEHGGHAILGQNLLHTQQGVDRYTHKSLIMEWAKALNPQKNKKITEAERNLSHHHQLVH